MMKTYALTMAYNRIDLIDQSLASFYSTCGMLKPFEHVLLDQHYPLPSRSEHRRGLEMLAKKYDLALVDAGHNLGYHEGINWVAQHLGMDDQDILVNYDPDSLCVNDDWMVMMRKAFRHDPTLAVVGLNNPVIDGELKERGHFDEVIDGLVLRFPKVPVIMSVVAWKWDFIKACGGLKENTALYGGIEATMFPILCSHQRRWAVLPEYWEDTSLNQRADPEYIQWKHMHGRFGTWKGDFDSYLRSVGRIP